MPGTDGLKVCQTLKKKDKMLPIIIVSAKDSPYDRVTGFSSGSDDYLVKPFLPLELIFRVKALLKRSSKNAENNEENVDTKYSLGSLDIYPQRRRTELSGKELMLTPGEFDFLLYMMKNKDRAVSRDELLKTIWQMNWEADTRAADDLVKRLRRKMRDIGSDVYVETVWGYGFRLSIKKEQI